MEVYITVSARAYRTFLLKIQALFRDEFKNRLETNFAEKNSREQMQLKLWKAFQFVFVKRAFKSFSKEELMSNKFYSDCKIWSICEKQKSGKTTAWNGF